LTEPVLIDTGPLVAVLYQRDSQHKTCVAQLGKLTRTPITCWPVLTEASHLLHRVGGSIGDLLRLISSKELEVAELGEESAGWLSEFLKRYPSIRVDLADAALMYLAERRGIEVVFTLDRRDFSIYRLGNGKPVRLLPD
jgi:hypothetical protein